MPPFFITPFLPTNKTFFGNSHTKLSFQQKCKVTPFKVAANTKAVLQTESTENDNDKIANVNQNSLEQSIQEEEEEDLNNIFEEDKDDDDDDDDPLEDASWFSVVKRIGENDVQSAKGSTNSQSKPDGILDLGVLDAESRQELTLGCYEKVVNIDIEEGGVLPDDEDNNDFFCGVGIEALIDNETLLKNLEKEFNIRTATHVQLSAIPRVLDGKDLVMQSHTGTGKTFAFLLPILEQIKTDRDAIQAVVIVPTRELAMQISRECDRLIQDTGIKNLALIGGANPIRQVDKLKRQTPHIVVGTPGRLAELHSQRVLKLNKVETMVVDEVDHCLEEAFMEDIIYLLRTASQMTQKVLVSATSDVDSVRQFTGDYLYKPVLLRVGGAQRIPKSIEHWYCVVPARLRIETLRKLIFTEPAPTRTIVFVNDPRRVDLVVDKLYHMRIPAGALRGNAHKLERAEVLSAFRKGKVNVLVTTEVAARGLDVKEISHVINLELPTDGDHYLHRAGRCGRVGNAGNVISIVTADMAFVINRLGKEVGTEIVRMEPRGGKYQEPLDRSRDQRSKVKIEKTQSPYSRNDVNDSKRPRKHSKEIQRRDIRSLTRNPIKSNKAGTSDLNFKQLTKAVQQGDTDLIESSINWGQKDRVRLMGVSTNEVSTKEISPKPKKSKKKRSKTRGTKGTSENSKTPGKTQISRKARRNPRDPRSIKARAQMEGWVGNRSSDE